MVNASASHARGPLFEPRREHSSFSLKYSDFASVAPRKFPGMGQARIETNSFNYLIIYLLVSNYVCSFFGKPSVLCGTLTVL